MIMSLKSYLLIKDWVDPGHAVNTAAHAGMMAGLDWCQDPMDPIVYHWLTTSFRKVTCQVTDEQFAVAKKFDDYLIITELAFDGAEVALIFKPREEWPKFFKYFKLWK